MNPSLIENERLYTLARMHSDMAEWYRVCAMKDTLSPREQRTWTIKAQRSRKAARVVMAQRSESL